MDGEETVSKRVLHKIIVIMTRPIRRRVLEGGLYELLCCIIETCVWQTHYLIIKYPKLHLSILNNYSNKTNSEDRIIFKGMNLPRAIVWLRLPHKQNPTFKCGNFIRSQTHHKSSQKFVFVWNPNTWNEILSTELSLSQCLF